MMIFFDKLKKYHYLVILTEAVLLLSLLLLFPGRSQGQDRTMIHGIVYEIESQMPLSGTHIILDGTSYGTISGPDGAFRLGIQEFPAKLKLTHIGFEDRFFFVEMEHSHDTIMLGMRFEAEMLDGITVSDKRIETIFRDESYSVLDFEFHENGLILLIFRNRLKSFQFNLT